MAYVKTTDLDEEKEQPQAGAPIQVAQGQPANIGTVVEPQAQRPGIVKPSPYTDVRSYLEANREQAKGLAGGITSQLKKEEEAFRTNVGQTESQIASDVAAQKRELTPTVKSQIVNLPWGHYGGLSGSLATDIQERRTGEYKGPTYEEAGEKYSALQPELTKLESRVPQIESAEGRKEFLLGMMKRPTVGQMNLNEMLLSGDPTAVSQMKEAVSKYPELKNYLAGSIGKTQSTIQAGEAGAKKYGEDLTKYLGDVLTGEKAGIETQTTNLRKSAQARADQQKRTLQNIVASKDPYVEWKRSGAKPDATMLKDWGITESQFWDMLGKISLAKRGWDPTRGINSYIAGDPLSDFRQYTPKIAAMTDYAPVTSAFSALNPATEIQPYEAMTKGQASYLQGLAQLAGKQPMEYVSMFDPAKAGTETGDITNYNLQSVMDYYNPTISKIVSSEKAYRDLLAKTIADPAYQRKTNNWKPSGRALYADVPIGGYYDYAQKWT